MAVFAPPLADKESGDPTRVTREPVAVTKAADTSGSSLFNAVTKVAGQAIQVTDTAFKASILNETRQASDKFFDDTIPSPPGDNEFDNSQVGRAGLDLEQEVSQDAFLGVKVPRQITDVFTRLQRQASGVAQGRVSESQRLTDLDVALKAIRHKYPGYRDYIDGEVRRLTGLPSANALRTARTSLEGAAKTANDKALTARMKIERVALAHGIPMKEVRRLPDHVLNRLIGAKQAEEYELKTYTAKQAAEALGINEKAQNAQVHATRNTARHLDYASIIATGKSMKENYRQLILLQRKLIDPKSPDVPQEEKAAAKSVVLELLRMSREVVTEEVTRRPQNKDDTGKVVSLGMSQYDYMVLRDKGLTVEQFVDSLLEGNTKILMGFVDGDLDIMELGAKTESQIVTTIANRYTFMRPSARFAKIATEVYGKDVVALYQSNDPAKALNNDLDNLSDLMKSQIHESETKDNYFRITMDTIVNGTSNPNNDLPHVTQKEAEARNKALGGTPKAIAARASLKEKGVIGMALDPTAPHKARLGALKHLFNRVDRGYMRLIKTSEQKAAYDRRYNPSMAKAVREIGTPRLKEQYVALAKDDLLSMKAHSGAAALLRSNKNMRAFVVFDPETGLAKFVKTPESRGPSPSDIGDGLGGFIGGGIRLAGELMDMQNARVLEEAVIDFNTIGMQFQRTMEELFKDELALDETDGNIPNAFLREFWLEVAGIPDFAIPSETSPNIEMSRAVSESINHFFSNIGHSLSLTARDIGISGGSVSDLSAGEAGGGEKVPQADQNLTPETTLGGQRLGGETFGGKTLGGAKFGDSSLSSGTPEDDGGQSARIAQPAVSGGTTLSVPNTTSRVSTPQEAVDKVAGGLQTVVTDVVQGINKAGLDLDAIITGIGSGSVGVDGVPTVPGEEARVARVNQSIAAAKSTDVETLGQRLGLSQAISRTGVPEDIQKSIFVEGTIGEEIGQRKLFLDVLNNDVVKGYPDVANFGSGLKDNITRFLEDGDVILTDPERTLLQEIGDRLSAAIGVESLTLVTPEEVKEPVDFEKLETTGVGQQLKPAKERRAKVSNYTSVQRVAFRPFLDEIAAGESAGSYYAMNNGTNSKRQIVQSSTDKATQVSRLGKPLTEMTINEVRALQKGTVKTGRKLFAAGKYQIIPDTMPEALKGSGLKGSDLFNEENQDTLGINLAMNKRPALGAYIRGDSTNLRAAMKGLALEWASFPHPDTGKSAYGKPNKAAARHSRKKVAAMLLTMRRAFSAEAPAS